MKHVRRVMKASAKERDVEHVRWDMKYGRVSFPFHFCRKLKLIPVNCVRRGFMLMKRGQQKVVSSVPEAPLPIWTGWVQPNVMNALREWQVTTTMNVSPVRRVTTEGWEIFRRTKWDVFPVRLDIIHQSQVLRNVRHVPRGLKVTAATVS